jgi:protein SCO1/2
MAKLQEELANEGKVTLVSISVDPEQDTPQVLSQYADRFKADPDRWLLLTGKKKEIYRLAQEGFRLSAVPASNGSQETNEIFHSSRFVLVDSQAQIRGYYDSADPKALQRLRQDVKVLLR